MRYLVAGLLLIAFVTPVRAQEAIGFVKTASGDATVTDAGKAVKASPGTPVRLGSVLRTGSRGSMGITFKDNSVMSFGPDTEVAVDEYLYAPGKGELGFGASMTKGTLNMVSGVIAKLKPDAARLRTPTGTIGIRGTHFAVKVEP
jgi:hypothetical protein